MTQHTHAVFDPTCWRCDLSAVEEQRHSTPKPDPWDADSGKTHSYGDGCPATAEDSHGTVTMWHVRFNGQPEVVGHCCDWHHTIGQALPCDDAPRGGDCEHVQTAPCTCAEPQRCDGCLAETAQAQRLPGFKKEAVTDQPLKVGDRVVVTVGHPDYNGQVGVVIGCYGESPNRMVRVQFADGRKCWPRSCTLIDDATKT